MGFHIGYNGLRRGWMAKSKTVRCLGHMASSANLSDDHLATLLSVLRLPFADGLELACITYRAERTVYRHLKRLTEAGLISHINRGTAVLHASYRHFPTSRGIEWAAASLGILRSEIIRRYPISKQWLEILLERLDTVATTYRFASALKEPEDVADTDGTVRPLTVEFRRSGAYDAILTLKDGRTIGMVRQGMVGPRSSIQWRMRSLARQSSRSGPANAIVLSPTLWDANVNRGYVSAGEGLRIHVFAETEALLHGWDTGELAQARTADRPDWSTIEYLVNCGLSDEFLPVRASPRRKRATIPEPEQLVEAQAGSELTRSQAVTFNSIALWLGICRQDLMALMGARSSQMSRLVRTLVGGGLVHNLGTRLDIRYAPTETGIRYWAERDRTDLGDARGKWASEGNDPADWKGTAISKMFGPEREHTPRLYWIVSSLSQAARKREDATLEWVLPAHRAARNFYIGGRQRTSIRPDALGALQLGERYVPFMLEYERQALYPSEAHQRLERYRNYFATGLPVEDHGTTPSVLFVFPTEEHEARFVAGVGGEHKVPILTSNLHVLEAQGVLSASWRRLWDPSDKRRVAP